MRNFLLYCSIFLIIAHFASAISLRNDNGYLHASSDSSRIQQTNNMTDISNHNENKNHLKPTVTFGSFIQMSAMSMTSDDNATANNTMTEEEKKKEEERKAEEERQAAIQKSQQELAEYRAFAGTMLKKLNDFVTELRQTQSNMKADLHAQLEESLTKLRETLDKEYKKSREMVANASNATRQYIQNKKEEIKKEVENVILKSNVSLCETRELKIIMYLFEQEEDRNKIEDYTFQIRKLQPTLPPMKSFCNEYLDCGICSANPSCGWCSSRDKCIDGDEVGPSNEICALYNYKICTGFNCGSKADCKECLEDKTCGWCEDPAKGTGTCLERASNYTGCSASSWYHSLGAQAQCATIDPSSPEGLEKEQKKKEWGLKKKERKEILEKLDEQLSDKDREIVEQQEKIIKMKQEIVKMTANIEFLEREIEAVEEEIVHCQRDRSVYGKELIKQAEDDSYIS